MADQSVPKAYERGIDGSRMADYEYGYPNGCGRSASFGITRAYQQGKPWVYADYWLSRFDRLLPGREQDTQTVHR